MEERYIAPMYVGLPRGGRVTLVDVFPRDGLQTLLHEPGLRSPSTAEKIDVIQALDQAGVPEIEITGFVHPRVIPSLADAEAVAEGVLALPVRARLRALVPNYRGAERAVAVGVPKLSCLIVVSETYQRLNSNMSVNENVAEIERIAELGARRGAEVTVSLGTSFICPYEGLLPEERLRSLVERFVGFGIKEIGLADSIGLAWPTLVADRCRMVLDSWPELTVGLHLHTVAGLALANAFAGYQAGARTFDGSVGGIGGGIAMPIHTTGMGNVATEDLAYMFESCGVATGIDQEAIAVVGRGTQQLIGTGGGHVTSFGTMERFLSQGRQALERVAAAPPGDSARMTGTAG
jgi:hydroxymethylglutaryl-CoA lyase